MSVPRFETLIAAGKESYIVNWDRDDEGNPIIRSAKNHKTGEASNSPHLFDLFRVHLVQRGAAKQAHNERVEKWRSR